MTVRPRPLRRLAGTAALLPTAGLLLAGLAGCGGGSPAATTAARSGAATGTGTSSAAGSSSGSGRVTGTAISTRPVTVAPAGESSAAAAAHPSGQATCTLLTASRAAQLVGGAIGPGVPDHRLGAGGERELDGCSYTGGGGLRLGYVVWQLSSSGTRATVQQGLPPRVVGVQTFAPGVGTASAGTVMKTGPVTSAQVNAVRQERLVQVGVTAGTADAARAAATGAARLLIGG
jgi:hypothetical protein